MIYIIDPMPGNSNHTDTPARTSETLPDAINSAANQYLPDIAESTVYIMQDFLLNIACLYCICILF